MVWNNMLYKIKWMKKQQALLQESVYFREFPMLTRFRIEKYLNALQANWFSQPKPNSIFFNLTYNLLKKYELDIEYWNSQLK